MRLIDADELVYMTLGEDTEKPFRFVPTEFIEDAPTIDAIPVEWLIKWAAEHTEYGTITVEKIIEDWENDKTNRKERNF